MMWQLFSRKRRPVHIEVPNVADITVVAIAKDEAPYLLEWVCHHLAIGVANFIFYNNDSSDRTGSILRAIATRLPSARVIDWPSVDGQSPQRSAYNHSLSLIQTEWVTFIDIDEFLVPWRDGSLKNYLDRADDEVSAIHINWRGFGSNGHTTADYGSVTEAFTRASFRNWENNYHYKLIGRARMLGLMHIHYADILSGQKVLSDFTNLDIIGTGQSGRVVHDGIQINHYQCKTFQEFQQRMQRGNVNYPVGHPAKNALDASRTRFDTLDRNEEEDTCILQFQDAMKRYIEILSTGIEGADDR